MREAMLNPVTGQMEYTQAPASNAVQPLINYSTEEQDTGQLWIDGRKIYQRTWTVTLNLVFTAVTWRNILDLPTDTAFGNLVDYSIVVPQANYEFRFDCVSLDAMSSTPSFSVWIGTTFSGNSTQTTHVTLWYTKDE